MESLFWEQGGTSVNKVYKVIWSKVKKRYIVVSELVKSQAQSKSSKCGVTPAAILAAFLLINIPGGIFDKRSS